MLELDPVLPGLIKRKAKQALELVRVVAFAFLVAAVPVDDLLGRIDVREIGDETRSIEVSVRARLEVDKTPRETQTQRIVEMGVVPDHRPEHHLVIPALRAAQSAAHPGLEEDGAAFQRTSAGP